MAATEMPPAELTVTEQLLAVAPARGGRPALVDAGSGRTITYSGLAATVCTAAAGLGRRGLRPGDVVALHVSGAVTFAVASHVIRAAGAAAALISPGACTDAAGAQLTRCDARMLITDRLLACASHEIAERSRVRQIISFGEVTGTTPFDSLAGAGPLRSVRRAGDDLALLVAAPGTGQALPVPVTNRELVASLRRYATDVKLSAWDVVVAAPFCGDGRGYCALLDLALADGTTVVAAPQADTALLVAVAATYRGTVLLVPAGTVLSQRPERVVVISP